MRMLTSLLAVTLILVPSLAFAETCRSTSSDEERDVCKQREIYLMPGVQGVIYAPNAKATQPFVGAGFRFTPLEWSHNSDKFGPSQGSIFFQTSLLRSAASKDTMALIEGGTQLSFERNSSREFLIPYFGTTIGGLVHGELPNAAFAYPYLGIHTLYYPNAVLDIEGGYTFPFSDLDTLRGPRGQATLRFSLW